MPPPPAVTISKIEVISLAASFVDAYGEEPVPSWMLFPASSHAVLPRRGQYAAVVRIEADDGTIGIGESYGLPSPEVPAAVIRTILAPLIVGQDALATTAIWERMYQAQAAAGHNRGFFMEAIAGIDLALWDLRGKLLGQPVHRLLGGPIRDRVPCYASPVALFPDPQLSAARAREFLDLGFSRIKVKIGRGRREDARHLAAVVAEVGTDTEVMVDANCAYDLDEATAVARVLDDLGIRWFEEPLAVDDLASLGELRRRTGLTIVNGETHFTRFDTRDSIAAGAVDVVMPNLTRCGGITEAVRIAAYASAHHVDVSPHGVGSGIGLCAALQFIGGTPNVRPYEYNQLLNPLREKLLRTPPVFADGFLEIPSTPGLGVELDDDVVDRYTTSRG